MRQDPKSLYTLGEFGLIDVVKNMTHTDASVLLGIGDDAAVLKFSGKEKVIFTTHILI